MNKNPAHSWAFFGYSGMLGVAALRSSIVVPAVIGGAVRCGFTPSDICSPDAAKTRNETNKSKEMTFRI